MENIRQGVKKMIGISTLEVSPQNQPVAVLGGTGFIGTRLARTLTDQRAAFLIGDIHPSDAFPEYWRFCDVRDGKGLDELLQGSKVIINLAAEHRDDVRPLTRYHETNVQGAIRVCSAARKAGISKIIFTSSVAVYGFQSKPVDENGPCTPFNTYGQTKLEAEGIYRAWADEDKSRTLVIIRPTVVFGEGNRGNVYNLLRQIATGKFLMVGSGNNTKSMAYVGNVAAFLLHSFALGEGIHIFNYVDGPDMSTKMLIEHIRRCLGRPGKPPRIPKALALAGGHILDIVGRLSGKTFPVSAIRVQKFCENTQFKANRIAESGFKPQCSLSEALARTVSFEFPIRSTLSPSQSWSPGES